jgi:rSAM/selenodomain-associated transferase 1
MKPLVILFAKAPVAGQVKTRLTPVLTASQAAQLHHLLVARLWQQLKSLHAELDVELHTDIETDAWPDAQPRFLQASGDLGVRMLGALRDGLAQRRPKTAIVGGDLHGLPDGHLRDLLAATSDIALGPSMDGGYYAIVCRRIHEAMFQGVRWSTPHALADTAAAALRCGLTIHVGQPWPDVDTPEDLGRLPSELIEEIRKAGPHT